MNKPQSETTNTVRDIPRHSKLQKMILAIAIILAGLLLILALRKVSWKEITQTIYQLKPGYLGLGFLFNSLALFLRGQRWGILISARKQTKIFDLFFASAIGYLGNTFLPARIGELLRSIVLGKESEISSSYVLATAFTERIIDALALVLIGSIVVQVSLVSLPPWILIAIWWIIAISIFALVIFLLAPFLENPFQKLLSTISMSEKWHIKLAGIVSQFLLGTRAFVHPGRMVKFITLTAILWLIDAIGSIVFARGLNLTMSLSQALLLLSALGLASALPSTPGFIGIYQFVAVTVMPTFGISPSQALTYILAGQTVYICVILLWGFIGLGRFGIKISNISDIL